MSDLGIFPNPRASTEAPAGPVGTSFRGHTLLGDKKDSQGDRDEVVIEGTDWIVYQTERVAISDCTWLLKSLTQYESQKLEDPA